MSMERFDLHTGDTPLVVSFPHSGLELSEGLDARLSKTAAGLPDTDWHVPQLYDFVAEMGASTICAKFSRYVIDMNRDPSGASLYPGQATTDLVPMTLFDGSPIYKDGQEPEPAEIEQRRIGFHQPYHQALLYLLAETRRRHGYAVLWDAHSIASHVPRLFEGELPNLNLGTNSGESCDPSVEAAASAAMQSHEDFTTIANGRFKGGWITRKYGQPAHNVHALQMEIAQSAYMAETAPWTFDDDKAARLRPVLKDIMQAALDAAAQHHKENRS
jgi:N-formylglutamate deformylase